MVNYKCLEKRSQALRGRNLTRDIQADGAPMVHLASGDQGYRGPFFRAIGHRSHASKIPRSSRVPGNQ